jgi:hypothetical protein
MLTKRQAARIRAAIISGREDARWIMARVADKGYVRGTSAFRLELMRIIALIERVERASREDYVRQEARRRAVDREFAL